MANEPNAEMRQLTLDAESEIDALMTALENGEIGVDAWEDSMQNLLVSYHLASWMTGQDDPAMLPDDLASVGDSVQDELIYLANFGIVIVTAAEFSQAWYARARMYANAFTRTFWAGKMQNIPVPAMPAQGTNCFSNCRCDWRVEILDENENVVRTVGMGFSGVVPASESGNYNCYWELDPFVEDGNHCQTCLERSDQWYPILIRDGILQV